MSERMAELIGERRVAPSILSADFSRLGAQVDEVMEAGARVIHFDVMDGHFVPPITIGPLVLASIADQVHAAGGVVDVHLMIEAPERQIEAFAEAGADSITFHDEATPHANRTLAAIRELGCLAGIAINPGTPVEAVAELRGLADIVLCMTVNPGWGGQAFIAGSPDKVARLATLVGEAKIEVDGGIDTDDRRPVADAGASLFVAGSAVFGAADPAAAYAESPQPPAPGSETKQSRTQGASVLLHASDRGRRNAPVSAPRDQGADDLLPPGSLGGVVAAALGAALAPAGERPAAADRDHVLGGHRVAAVGEGDQGAGPVAAAAQHRDAPRCRRPRSGAEGSSIVARPGRTEKICGAPRGGSCGGGGVADRPLVPAPGQLLDLLAQLAADEDVQLVALAQLGRAARRDRVRRRGRSR